MVLVALAAVGAAAVAAATELPGTTFLVRIWPIDTIEGGGFTFDPDGSTPPYLRLAPGDRIRWENPTASTHTVDLSDSPPGVPPLNLTLAPDAAAERTFEVEGTYIMVGSTTGADPYFGNFTVAPAPPPNAPPVVSIVAPTATAGLDGTVAVETTATDADGDALTVHVRVDEGAWSPATLDGDRWTWAWDTTAVANGPHALAARANDGAVDSEVATLAVTVDNAAGVTLADAPTSAVVGDVVALSGSAWAAPGSPLWVNVSTDGGATNAPAVVTGSAWSFAWDTSGLDAGERVVRVCATDGAPERTVCAADRVVVLEAAPPPPPPPPPPPSEPPAPTFTLQLFSPDAGAEVDGLVNVTGRATGPLGHAFRVELAVDDGPWTATSGLAYGWWFVWDARAAAPGEHMLRARAVDDHGHALEVGRPVTVARPMPEFRLSDLRAPAKATVGQSFTVSVGVRNDGTADGTAFTLLLVNGVVRDSRSVIVAAGGRDTIDFDFTPAQGGELSVTVRLSMGEALPALTVDVASSPPPPTPTPPPPSPSTPPSPTPAPPSPASPTAPAEEARAPVIPAPGVAAALLALAAALVFARGPRRR